MKRLAVVLSTAVVIIGLLPAPAMSATPAAPVTSPSGSRTGGPSVFVGDLTAAQLALVMDSGIDRQEVVARSGESGSTAVEVILGAEQAGALIAAGVPLQSTDRRSAGRPAVFRPYTGPGGLSQEYAAIANQHPTLVKRVIIGKTVQGRDIVALKVTRDANRTTDGTRPAVLYVAAQHGREWISAEMDRRLLHHLIDNYPTDKTIHTIVDTTELWFVPVANPDGYDFTFTDGHRLWRKNLSDNNGDGVIDDGDGVDLDRNFPTQWGYDNEGSSPNPFAETYRGPEAGSEPETRALDGLMDRIGFTFLVDYHSAAERLSYGAGWQVATPSPEDVISRALVGDDARPAVPGSDPSLAAERYSTNGGITDRARAADRTVGFTAEMSSCRTAADSDPDDQFLAEDCASSVDFPDSEALVQAEFEKNIPFALSVARSARNPAHPVSAVDLVAPDFVVDSFDVSYGDPQTVAVTARRDVSSLAVHYRVNGGPEQRTGVREWRGGERYGGSDDLYYGEFRGTIRATEPGDSVEVWFTGTSRSTISAAPPANTRGGGRTVASEHFSYTVHQDGGAVLVLANSSDEAVGAVAALAASGISTAVWDVSAQGVPHDLGVLGHFRAVVWSASENPPENLRVSVRDYLNAGGKVAYFDGTANDNDGAADDFTRYYLGVDGSVARTGPGSVTGTAMPFRDAAYGVGGSSSDQPGVSGVLTATSDALPVEEFPQFRSQISSVYREPTGSPAVPYTGDSYAGARHSDGSYLRLSRKVDLTAVPAFVAPRLGFALSYDTGQDDDSVIVEVHTIGSEDWTTLPEAGGRTTSGVPADCGAGFLLDRHPFLSHYLSPGDPCLPDGSTGSWHRLTGSSGGWQQLAFDLSGYAGQQIEVAISYVTDGGPGGAGIFVDDTTLTVGDEVTVTEGFESGPGPWTVPGAPAGSPPNAGDFVIGPAPPAAASVTTPDTVVLGYRIDQLPDPVQRAAAMAAIAGYLGVRGGR